MNKYTGHEKIPGTVKYFEKGHFRSKKQKTVINALQKAIR